MWRRIKQKPSTILKCMTKILISIVLAERCVVMNHIKFLNNSTVVLSFCEIDGIDVTQSLIWFPLLMWFSFQLFLLFYFFCFHPPFILSHIQMSNGISIVWIRHLAYAHSINTQTVREWENKIPEPKKIKPPPHHSRFRRTILINIFIIIQTNERKKNTQTNTSLDVDHSNRSEKMHFSLVYFFSKNKNS